MSLSVSNWAGREAKSVTQRQMCAMDVEHSSEHSKPWHLHRYDWSISHLGRKLHFVEQKSQKNSLFLLITGCRNKHITCQKERVMTTNRTSSTVCYENTIIKVLRLLPQNTMRSRYPEICCSQGGKRRAKGEVLTRWAQNHDS
jgi:hypothetical protein